MLYNENLYDVVKDQIIEIERVDKLELRLDKLEKENNDLKDRINTLENKVYHRDDLLSF